LSDGSQCLHLRASIYVFSHTTSRIDVELGAKLFRHLLALPLAYFQARRVGDSVARVRELENIRSFLTGQALTLVLDLVFSVVFIAVMFAYSVPLTLIVLASLPLYVGLSLLVVPILRKRLDEKFARGAENQALLVETVTGIQTVKAGALEPQVARKWENQLAAYVVDATADVVSEAADQGIDTVQSSVNVVLGSNVENLTLTGSTATAGSGNALNNVLTGNGIGNTLDAGAGDDTLNGGAGVDTLIGGTGNDLYIANTASDVITESANEGIDTVQSSATLTLAANVENLTLTGTSNLNGTGNAGANWIAGNGGNNTLDGGAGLDTLRGGAGNDVYAIDDAGDVVAELANEGVDLVRASVTVVLSADVENLTLTGTPPLAAPATSWTTCLPATAPTTHSSPGRATTRSMVVRETTRSMVVWATTRTWSTPPADVVTEAADEGVDTVQSSVTLTLGDNVENLTLSGTGNSSGSGNALDNGLTGNAGNNVLSGGAGNDLYNGGAGNDTLSDNSATSNDIYRWGLGQGSDTITDGGGADRIEIAAGVTASLVSLARNGNNLQVKIGSSTDVLTVVNWYAATANRIETIALADGSVVDAGTAAAPVSLAVPGVAASREWLQMRNVVGEAALSRNARLLTEAMAGFALGGEVSSGGHWQRVREPMHGILTTPQ
jgi:Ca2+-binding RTX toxin-like protein